MIIAIKMYNKFQISLIKLDKGETNIQSLLVKKYNILLRYVDLLKNNIKVNQDDFDKYNFLNTKQTIY